jgi:hypothetical protein
LVDNDQVGFSIEGYLGMKLKAETQLKTKINMNKLPDGEHTIEGKIYIVKDGEITEIRDVKVEETTEEVALEDTVVEEEEVVEETMAVDPVLDAEAILAIVKPALDAEVNNLVAMIADLKAQLEDAMSVDSEEEVVEEVVALSVQQRLSNFIKFNNQ